MAGTDQPDIKNYRIDKELGRGGMATVYLANQLLLDRSVALKVMLPEFSQAVFQDAFLHEGKVIAQLEHPNIIKIYDIGIVEQHFYMAMEYLAGGTLRDLLAREALAPDQVFDILQQVGSGLDFSHQRGFIHRDIKPANILFRYNGEAVLTDFGIAKLQNSTGEMTRIGMTAGTAHYMSPEQAATGELDNRSDLYSLALVVFEMLSGEKVCQADSLVQAIHQHTVKPPPDLPAKYHLFQPVLHKALAKEPLERHRTVQEFVDDFAAALTRYQQSQASTYVAAMEPEAGDDDKTALFNPTLAAFETPNHHQQVAPRPVVRPQEEETPIWRRPLPVIILAAVVTSVVAAAVLIPAMLGEQPVEPVSDRPSTQITIPPVQTNNGSGGQSVVDATDSNDSALVPADTTDNQQPADGNDEPDISPPPVPEPVTPVVDNTDNTNSTPQPHQFPSRVMSGLWGQEFVVDSSSGLNVRSYPRQAKNNIILKLDNRAKVKIVSDTVFPEVIRGKPDVWVQIIYAGQVGYVYKRHIKPVATTPVLTAGCHPHSGLAGKSFVIKKLGSRLFKAPFSNTPLSSLAAKQVVVAQENILCQDTVSGKQGDWMRVKIKGQAEPGYIFDQDAFPLNKDKAERVVFAPGATSYILQGEVGFRQTKRYSFGSAKGQRMYLEPLGSSSVTIYAYGADDEILAFDAQQLDADLGATQRYYVTFFGDSPGSNKYHYEIFIVHQ